MEVVRGDAGAGAEEQDAAHWRTNLLGTWRKTGSVREVREGWGWDDGEGGWVEGAWWGGVVACEVCAWCVEAGGDDVRAGVGVGGGGVCGGS